MSLQSLLQHATLPEWEMLQQANHSLFSELSKTGEVNRLAALERQVTKFGWLSGKHEGNIYFYNKNTASNIKLVSNCLVLYLSCFFVVFFTCIQAHLWLLIPFFQILSLNHTEQNKLFYWHSLCWSLFLSCSVYCLIYLLVFFAWKVLLFLIVV